MRACFLREQLDQNHLRVLHCPGEVQLADTLTKALPHPRLVDLNTMLGLGQPSHIDPTVQAVMITSRAFQNLEPSEGQSVLLILALMMTQVVPAASQEEDNIEGVSLDLYIVGVMLACSILFFWELGKHCVRECICLRRSGPSVASVRADDETQLERRLRRQDAVRRAVEREATEHLFAGSTLSRTTEGDSTSVPPPSPAVQASSHVHLHVSPMSGSITDPNPAASSPLSSSRLFPRMSGSSTSEGLPPGPPPPPPPFRESGTGYTRREGARSVLM